MNNKNTQNNSSNSFAVYGKNVQTALSALKHIKNSFDSASLHGRQILDVSKSFGQQVFLEGKSQTSEDKWHIACRDVGVQIGDEFYDGVMRVGSMNLREPHSAFSKVGDGGKLAVTEKGVVVGVVLSGRTDTTLTDHPQYYSYLIPASDFTQ